MSVYWHYTTGDCLQLIRDDGLIRPAYAGIQAYELGIVWFSSRESWEPTASKGVVGEGARNGVTASLQQMHDYGGGIYRLRVEGVTLYPWPRIGVMARMSKKIRKALEQVAAEVGSDPLQWAGTIEPILVDRMVEVEQIDPATGVPQSRHKEA